MILEYRSSHEVVHTNKTREEYTFVLMILLKVEDTSEPACSSQAAAAEAAAAAAPAA